MAALSGTQIARCVNKFSNICAISRLSRFSSISDNTPNNTKQEILNKTKNEDDISTENSGSNVNTGDDPRLGGFARAFEKFSNPMDSHVATPPTQDESFLALLKNSKFVNLGDPQNKIVQGTIYHVVGDDLYIDFGGKFPCVCLRPARNGNAYVRGARVRLRLKDLELSTRFLGSERDLTLLEADATLLGVMSTPAARV